MEELEQIVHCNVYENAKLIKTILDYDIDGETPDIVEVKYAHYYEHDDGKMRCSNCGASKIGYNNYCSNCGAKILTDEQWKEKLIKGVQKQ